MFYESEYHVEKWVGGSWEFVSSHGTKAGAQHRAMLETGLTNWTLHRVKEYPYYGS